MIIGLLKEPAFETRSSLLPEHIAPLIKLNVDVIIESGAGEKAFATDDKFKEAGATVVSRQEVLQKADLLLAINPIADAEVAAIQSKVVIGFFQSLSNYNLIHALSKNRAVMSNKCYRASILWCIQIKTS